MNHAQIIESTTAQAVAAFGNAFLEIRNQYISRRIAEGATEYQAATEWFVFMAKQDED